MSKKCNPNKTSLEHQSVSSRILTLGSTHANNCITINMTCPKCNFKTPKKNVHVLQFFSHLLLIKLCAQHTIRVDPPVPQCHVFKKSQPENQETIEIKSHLGSFIRCKCIPFMFWVQQVIVSSCTLLSKFLIGQINFKCKVRHQRKVMILRCNALQLVTKTPHRTDGDGRLHH